MKKSLKDRKFKSDIDIEYAKKYNKKLSGTTIVASECFPIVTEERVEAAIKLLKLIRKK